MDIDKMDQEIMAQTLRFIQQETSSDADFNEQALALFKYQFTYNRPYQVYCRTKGKTPRIVKHWQDIPAVPINAFKEVTLSCTDAERASATFMTSGTTSGNKGKHYHPQLTVYNLSTLTHFKAAVMGATPSIPMGLLFPTPQALPNSSLAHYLALVSKEFGQQDTRYFINESGLLVDELIAELEVRVAANQPYALLGASFSFVHLFEALAARNQRFVLPKGSKLLDTGGYKNQSSALDTDTFYQQMTYYLGVEPSHCINMFGMTELSSQLYTQGSQTLPATITGPHWIRTRVVNPTTGEEVSEGEPGVLVQIDLANYNSVAAILTEDIGIKKDNGFLFLGRVQGAEAKGCSLALNEFMHSLTSANP
ncbi:hypothetical protein [Oceanisphaera pacifica]|uniref:Acyl-protein synthetase LuxE domain-containing protein n=1 Tax=Oceanisphaera pacifica TaxID=2818389 RepID=A0ABS3NIG7_9GAMM|nr:hypothetical protein [Oceanisphaera pacifica]MBO1520373.1 hypothetical protein [Oceanisphaera pacifica]